MRENLPSAGVCGVSEMTLGQKLRQLREERGWTQREVAERIGVIPHTISDYECGRSFPGLDNLGKLQKLFGVSFPLPKETRERLQGYSTLLIDAMKRKGMTRRELAERSGIPCHSIAKYVRGVLRPTRQRAEKIEQVLGVEIWDKSSLVDRREQCKHQKLVMSAKEKTRVQAAVALFCALYQRVRRGIESGEIRLSPLYRIQVQEHGLLTWFLEQWHIYAARQRELGQPIDFHNLILELLEEQVKIA